jgi:NADH-quinone oxidoreductase subunit G
VFPPGEAREDWRIIRALSEALGHKLPYDTPGALHATRPELFGQVDRVVKGTWGAFGAAGTPGGDGFASPVGNFYMTDPISRASLTMAQCAESYVESQKRKTGTHG